jgi:hypothetical protein
MEGMNKREIGRVLDPEALALSSAPCAKLSVTVPEAWAAEGSEIVVTAPAQLVCARCDGGGCDACDRSGALRAPPEPERRVVRLRVPAASGGVAIRLSEPFGPECPIGQLIVAIRPGLAPSAGVVRSAPLATSPRALPPTSIVIAVVAALLAVLAAVIAAR